MHPGEVFSVPTQVQFEAARKQLLRAAEDLDNTLNVIKDEDPTSWQKIIGAMNRELAKIPDTNLSSESVQDVIDYGLEPIPEVFKSNVDSPALSASRQIEARRYAVRMEGGTVPGLGFIPAIVAPISSGCATAAASTALTGIGPVVVGIGCALLVAAVVVGTLFFVYKTVSQIPRMIQSFSPQAAASLAEAERLKSVGQVMNEAGGLPPDIKAKILEQMAQQSKADAIPWAALVAVLGIAAFIYFRRPRKSEPSMVQQFPAMPDGFERQIPQFGRRRFLPSSL